MENPTIALAVFVEHGEGGSGVAGPIAKTIMDAYLLDEQGDVKQEFLVEPEIIPEQQLSSVAPSLEAL